MRPDVGNRISILERRLRKRIRFLLPPIVAIVFIFGYTFVAMDFLATSQFRGLLPLCFLQLILVVNIVLRRRFQKQLGRLLNGCCTNCGYDLRATPERCPECGQARKFKARGNRKSGNFKLAALPAARTRYNWGNVPLAVHHPTRHSCRILGNLIAACAPLTPADRATTGDHPNARWSRGGRATAMTS